jgi:pyruvate/2-oxoglutarate dehydrogenase complex dihydrolipoamide acyltransferase (E2) component
MLKRRNKVMMNNRTVFISIMIVLLVSLILPACAPAKPAATAPAAPAATTPAAPAATIPATPAATPPAAPATSAPASKALSFEPVTYTNDELGFTWQYPKTWINGDLSGSYIVHKLSGTAADADTAGIMVINTPSDYAAALKAEFEADPGLKQYGTKVTIAAVKTTTLADGKTTATEATGTAKIMGLYDLSAYTIGINKGGKTIIAFGATLGAGAKQALMKEMSQTLAVK